MKPFLKTSNKLLIGLLALALLTLIGANMALKAEFEKIDPKNSFYGYELTTLPPFRAIKLVGDQSGIVQLQPGKRCELRLLKKFSKTVSWKQNGDTLELTFDLNEKNNTIPPEMALNWPAVVYLTSPSLHSVQSAGPACKLQGWQSERLVLEYQGKRVGILLENSKIGTLMAVVREQSLLRLGSQNEVGNAQLEVRDESSLVVESIHSDSIRIQADPDTHIQISGHLFSKLVQP